MNLLLLTGYFLSGAAAGNLLKYCSDSTFHRICFCVLTGFLFLLAGLRTPLGIQLFFIWLFLFCIAIEAYIDYRFMILPDEILLILLLAGFLNQGMYFNSFWDVFSGALTGSLLIGMIYILSKGGIGLGDVKFSAVLGLWLGISGILVCLAIAFLSGGIASVLLFLSGKASMQSKIPFGPFLGIGAVLSMLFSFRILSWYWSLFI